MKFFFFNEKEETYQWISSFEPHNRSSRLSEIEQQLMYLLLSNKTQET